MPTQDHWLPGFNFNVEEWDAKGQTYETLAICRLCFFVRKNSIKSVMTLRCN